MLRNETERRYVLVRRSRFDAGRSFLTERRGNANIPRFESFLLPRRVENDWAVGTNIDRLNCCGTTTDRRRARTRLAIVIASFQNRFFVIPLSLPCHFNFVPMPFQHRLNVVPISFLCHSVVIPMPFRYRFNVIPLSFQCRFVAPDLRKLWGRNDPTEKNSLVARS